MRWTGIGALMLGAGVMLATTAQADELADFYKGKTFTIVCSTSAGGGYDTLARTVARHLGKHIPGNPTVVVKNMPGAGGIVATNFLFNNAEKDGTTIGLVQNNTPFEPLFGTQNARYTPTQFNWLSSPSVETGVVVVWHTVPVSSIADVKTKPITVGADGVNSTAAFYTRVLNDVLGLEMKVIAGYAGQTEAFIAMERGEVDGHPSVFYSTLKSIRPDWLPQKKVKVILQYGPERQQELGNVPYAPDLAKPGEDRELLDVAFAPLALGRPFVMPPAAPAARVAAIRKAMSDTFADKDYIADAVRTGIGADAPRDGAQIQQVIEKTYSSPTAVLERLKKIYTAGG